MYCCWVGRKCMESRDWPMPVITSLPQEVIDAALHAGRPSAPPVPPAAPPGVLTAAFPAAAPLPNSDVSTHPVVVGAADDTEEASGPPLATVAQLAPAAPAAAAAVVSPTSVKTSPPEVS